MPMTVLGAGLLWFGWFGFNAGSALTAGGLAASAFVVTNIAAAAATITWVGASYLHKGKVSVVGAACGAVAGLVAITPASGFVTVGGALIIGLVAGGLCYSATLLREPHQGRRRARRLRGPRRRRHVRRHRDRRLRDRRDPGGATAASSTATPARSASSSSRSAATIGYAVVGTFVIVKVVDVVLGMRVTLDPGGGRPRPRRPRRGRLPELTGRAPAGRGSPVRRSGRRPPNRLATLRDRPPPLLPTRRPVAHPSPETRPWRRHPALRLAVRARRVRRRVRGGRRRAVARPGPAAGAGRVSRRSATAARSAPTASRATAPASRSRSTGPLARRCSPDDDAGGRPGIVFVVPAARPRRRPGAVGRSSSGRSPRPG